MDIFRNSYICVHRIQMAAYIKKTVENEKRTFSGRSSYGIILKLSGKTRYLFPREDFSVLLESGCVLYLPQGSSYTAITEEEGDCIAVNFTGSVQLPSGCRRSKPFVRTAASPKLENLFRHLYDCLNSRLQPDACSEYTAMSLLYEIFKTIGTPVRTSDNGMAEVQELIRSRIADPALTIAELADASGLSISYFRKVFTETYGIAPVRYITLLRIAHARKLLAETRMSVSDIAEASGFTDVYYFSRIFTKSTGLSPTAYRKNYEASF